MTYKQVLVFANIACVLKHKIFKHSCNLHTHILLHNVLFLNIISVIRLQRANILSWIFMEYFILFYIMLKQNQQDVYTKLHKYAFWCCTQNLDRNPGGGGGTPMMNPQHVPVNRPPFLNCHYPDDPFFTLLAYLKLNDPFFYFSQVLNDPPFYHFLLPNCPLFLQSHITQWPTFFHCGICILVNDRLEFFKVM